MRMPNGYGGIIRLRGKRRRPYAVRTSTVVEFVDIYFDDEPQDETIQQLRKLDFKKHKTRWSAISTDKTRSFAYKLSEELNLKIATTFRQIYKIRAYFEKPELAYSYLADLNNGNVVKEHVKYTDVPTFAEMYELWKKYRKGLKKDISESSWRNYDISFNHFATLHNRKFVSLRTTDIQDVFNSYNHKSKSTIGSMRALITALYSYALMNNYVDTDATTYLVYEWTDTQEEIHAPFTTEEIALLWKNLYEVSNVDMILIYIYTGMRPSELLNILTENVHLDEQYMIGGMKTDAGKDRIIPIADKILPLIKNRYNPDRKYLITNTNGNHYSYAAYNSTNFKNVMNKLKLKHVPHDGRHTFATLMDNAGANEVCTKLIMGHSLKDDITKDVYTHKSISDLLTEVNKI